MEMQRLDTVFVRDHCVSIVNYYSVGGKGGEEWKKHLGMNLLNLGSMNRVNNSYQQRENANNIFLHIIIISGMNG